MPFFKGRSLPAPPIPNDKKKSTYFFLGLIIVSGFILRLYKLSSQSIWLDEAYSIYHSQQNFIHAISFKDLSPPLYYVLLHFWIKFTGTSVFSVRLLSVLFGTASVFIIYLLGAHIFNKKVGIYSALLVACSPLHIYFSQEARTYSILFTLTLLSMYFYSKLSKVTSKWIIAGYLISTVFLIYAHLYALLIFLVQNLHQFIVNRFKLSREVKAWVLLQFIVFIFYIPRIIQLPGIILDNYHSWIAKPSFLELIYMIYFFFSGTVFSFYGLALMLICSLLVLRYKLGSNILFPLWILIPILIPFTYSLLFTPIFIPKYTYFVSLPLYLIASRSLFSMKAEIRPILISAMIILSIATLLVQQNKTTKDPWNKAAEYIQTSNQKEDKVIIITSYEILPFSYYFDQECFQSNDLYTCSYNKGIYPVDSLQEVKKIDEKQFWLIISRGGYNAETPKVLNYINDNYTETESREYSLNHKSGLINKLYKYFEANDLISFKFNRIKVTHFQKKQNGA
ncbi:MAG: glycosyltransferase family 39 protein [Nitrospirae bacterium]|nr:glycosyltransferase family 39 protein [Nitrospirota bacterium]